MRVDGRLSLKSRFRGHLSAWRVVLALGFAALADGSALAQVRPPVRQPAVVRRPPGNPRGFLTVDGLSQLTTQDVTEERTIPWHGENATLEVAYAVPRTLAFGVTGGLMLTRNFGVGAGLSRFSTTTTTTAAVSADVPHPFFFNQARQVSGSATGMVRAQRSFDIHARGVFPVSAMQMTVFGGPSFLWVQRDAVSSIRVIETYPYDTASLGDVEIVRADVFKLGLHAGVDLAYYWNRNVGLGGTVQLWRAKAEPDASDGSAQPVMIGGTRVGGGLRLRF